MTSAVLTCKPNKTGSFSLVKSHYSKDISNVHVSVHPPSSKVRTACRALVSRTSTDRGKRISEEMGTKAER